MNVRQLIRLLDLIVDKDKKILVASDEEWNTLFENVEVNENKDSGNFVISGLSGSEVEDE